MEPWQLSVSQSVEAMADGSLDCVDLIESVLLRIDDLNPTINALVSVDSDGAGLAAQRADEMRRAGGSIGPLHGVPVTIKANLDVAGHATTSGVAAFIHKTATEDAPAVRNLKAAGAIVIGRSNMPEFGIRGTTFNPLFGRTLNPWADDASPGGSSGGAGAAAAAGFGPLHQGSDIGGSLRFPAFGCGVASVKPTSFRVPAYNASSSGERGVLSQTISCQGVLAPRVDDVRRGLRSMIAPDPRAPLTPPVPWRGERLMAPVTVAVSRDWGPHAPHPGIVALIDRAADHLAGAGYCVVDATPPPIEDAFRAWLRVATTELAVGLGPVVERFGSEDTRQLLQWTIDSGEVLGRDGYMASLGDRTRMARAWTLFMVEYPLVLTPFMTQPMYDWDFDTRSHAEVDEVLERSMHAFGINHLGLPAGVIGMDLVEERPAGVQIVGRPFREDLVCDALEAIELGSGILSHRLW